MSKVEESDVTSQSCWQCVLCSALPNPMLKNKKNWPHSSKQLPKPPQHESRGETAVGIQALIPVLIIPLRFPQRCFSNTLEHSAVCEYKEQVQKIGI